MNDRNDLHGRRPNAVNEDIRQTGNHDLTCAGDPAATSRKRNLADQSREMFDPIDRSRGGRRVLPSYVSEYFLEVPGSLRCKADLH